MLVAMSAILVGVKQYRDQELGGGVRFRTAVAVGIALVASIAYIVVWEIYLATTNYAFMDQYISQMLAEACAAGVSDQAYQKTVSELEEMRRQYINPLFRLPITFLEILPVGLLVALASAALLRNPKFLPART